MTVSILVKKISQAIRINTLHMKSLQKRKEAVILALRKIGIPPQYYEFTNERPATGRVGGIVKMSNKYRINYRCGYGRYNYAPCIEIETEELEKIAEFLTGLKVNAYAEQLQRHDSDLNANSAKFFALDDISHNPDKFEYLLFEGVKGGLKRRVVLSESYRNHYQSKGTTGRKPKKGQQLFIDAARFACGLPNAIISTYSNNIIQKF